MRYISGITRWTNQLVKLPFWSKLTSGITTLVAVFTLLGILGKYFKQDAHIDAVASLGFSRGYRQQQDPVLLEPDSVEVRITNSGTDMATGVSLQLGTVGEDKELHEWKSSKVVHLASQHSEMWDIDLNRVHPNGIVICVTYNGALWGHQWRLLYGGQEDFTNKMTEYAQGGLEWPWQDASVNCDRNLRALAPTIAKMFPFD